MADEYGPVSAIVECETCGWSTQSYKNAQALAAQHAKKHGHRVKGEVTIVFVYDGRKS